MILGILLGGCIVYMTIKLFNSKKLTSMEYRKLLTNLYVAGKIREIATKNHIDLTKEYTEFNKLFQRRRNRDIDDVVEEKLNKQINKELETKSK